MDMSPFQRFIYTSKYSKWIEEKGRRENWGETVDRWWGWMQEQAPQLSERPDIREAVYNLEVMPSMRALMTAGPAADRDNTSIYNCSYLELDSPIAMAELLYVLMNGTGVGYSVERRVVDKWTPVPEDISRDESVIITVKDSKAGWADAVKALLSSLMGGVHPTWDVSKVRPAGARLKTFGGRASGPGPLEDCMRFICNTIYNARGRRLRPIEVHDIACVIANSVIVGGVRRSAMISLSDLDDHEMARAKSGNWWEKHSYRALANNSAVYTEKPEMDVFMEEWLSIYRSYSGERGLFNRQAAQLCSADIGRDDNHHFGTNPCGEITLRPMSFCNLSEVVVRPDMDAAELNRRVEIASIIGTVQSKCTHFPYLRKAWQRNAHEERLLGVSLTGIQDNRSLSFDEDAIAEARMLARSTNKLWADKLGIEESKAVTTVKPSGTVSCLVDSASGIHHRYAPYYIRRVRCDKKDPLYQLMVDAGVPGEDCVNNPANTFVFDFVIGFQGKPTRGSAQDMLEDWAQIKRTWTDHNPSVTIEYRPEEFMAVGSELYGSYWEIAQGLSFLPRSEHVYKQAPYEEITKEEYDKRVAAFPDLDWSKLAEYEKEDNTKSSQTLACAGGSCEIVDVESN
jgi:ribonucleoside-diphosphate reductase alpha chain